jgi:hypothetical protein
MTVYVGSNVASGAGSGFGQAQVHQRAREAPNPAAVHAPIGEAQSRKEAPRPVAQSSPSERPRRDVPRGSFVNILV